MSKLKKIENMDLSERAFNVYSNSDLIVYIDKHGEFWTSMYMGDEPLYIGGLSDLNEFLIELGGDDNE